MSASTESGQQPAYSTPRPSYKYTCPVCNGPVYRVRRRFIDKLLCLFIHVRRYKCFSPFCAWEGTLLTKPGDSMGG